MEKDKTRRKMKVLSTKAIRLSRSQPIKAVSLLLPPGISTFYVERLDRNHIRFIIPEKEITRIEDEIHKMNKGKKAGFELKDLPPKKEKAQA